MKMFGSIVVSVLMLSFVLGAFHFFQVVTAALTGATGLTGRAALRMILIEVAGLAILLGLALFFAWVFGLL